ncbi:P-loop containing nucleoside triphosphate hydrolase protein [Gautieria morchelliformis]|nr:P-loop containing nucleoside triphosphate hydrolase protein [Gautieria morchelliformis]
MPPKAKNQHGLGRAIINKQAKDARYSKESDLYTTDLDATGRLKSVTQERDLDEFLSTAQLAATDFTAERQNVKIIQSPSLNASSAHNTFLLTAEEEKDALRRHRENRDKLLVPRRPPWTKDLTPAQLERQERDAFLEWRRSLAELAEEQELLLTPFERNIEVWRQLWRVLERSHLIVQIVDARNPLRFRCEDLESYVLDIEGPEGESGSASPVYRRKNLLLINKADLLTNEQRRQWADYFDQQGITYAFFSAANAAALQQARREAQEATDDVLGVEDTSDDEDDGSAGEENESDGEGPATEPPQSDSESDVDPDETLYYSAEEDISEDDRTKVLSVLELEELFIKTAPKLPPADGDHPPKLTVGLVGYPNVGKSSTINSLLGEKKVSVSATPGKTKHFQTINLSSDLMLCDCPGLVFPQFAVQKAELVCDGVLPVDQLRESHGPVALVTNRIGRDVLEATYGLTIRRRGEETGIENDDVSAEDLLIAYASTICSLGQGNPDESRAARYVLKDYMNAKLLFCHPPPGTSEEDFNIPTKQNALRRLEQAGKKKAPVTRVGKSADTFMHPNLPAPSTVIGLGEAPVEGQKSRALDASFFAGGSQLSARPFVQGQAFSRSKSYPHQNSVADDGTAISGRRARLLAVLGNHPDGVAGPKGKKHHKGNKRIKQRSGKGYD